MAAHDVNLEIPNFPIGKADLNFKVKKDGAVFGTLKISHGAPVWVPASGRNHLRVSWKQLDEFFKDKGTQIKKVKA